MSLLKNMLRPQESGKYGKKATFEKKSWEDFKKY